MKQVLVKAYTACNLGDDLFLDILFKKYPKINFNLITPYQQVNYYLTYKNVKCIYFPIIKYKLWFRVYKKIIQTIFHITIYDKEHIKYIKKLADSNDIFLCIGGSMFMENKNNASEFKQNHWLTHSFRDKPKFILGANFGPFYSNKYLKNYSKLFSKYTDICFRDSYSAQLFKNIDSTIIRNHPDIVFQYPQLHCAIEHNTIGFSIIDLEGRAGVDIYKEDYYNFIIKVINYYQNYKIRFFSFCEAEQDSKAINEIICQLSDLDKKRVEHISYNGDIHSILKIYASTEIMFCTRFHAAILSIINNQKNLPIIYSDKTLNTFKEIEYSGNFLRLNDLKSIEVAETLKLINPPSLIDVNELKSESTEHFRIISKYLDV